MQDLCRESVALPGAAHALIFERSEQGALVRVSANGREYFRQSGGERVYEAGFVVTTETPVPNGMLRKVSCASGSWVEEYLWNSSDRLARIDGVEIIRDAQQRITACRGPVGEWFYGYAGEHLAVIDGPRGVRHVTRAADGRPLRVRESSAAAEINYDPAGRREQVPPAPSSWYRDSLGRLWTITGADGEIRTTFFWDGFACLGRIDGAPGDPLTAVFSLDPTATPVRVITRSGAVCVPRDGFGESLLEHDGVPGLFGGSVWNGFVHLRSRTLDPITGSFASPDPLHGLENDPRRAEGYCGPLLVDNKAAGPYAVCQNDPVGRIDATGEISGWLVLSDFTWSLQNNIAGWLGLETVLSFWGSLFGGKAGRYFGTFEGLSSSHRLGSFGIKRDGVFSKQDPDRAWTYQHIVYAPPDHLEEQRDTRVFAPNREFRPTLYGTLLRAVPKDGDPFLLQGTRNPGNVSQRAPSWTRAGGPGEPALPGSRVLRFPSGGFHLDTVLKGFRGTHDCTLSELVPSGALLTGTIDEKGVITLNSTPGNISAGDLVALDTTGRAEILKVDSVVGTTLVVATEAALLNQSPLPLRLRRLGTASPKDTFTVKNATAVLLDGQNIATPAPYATNDVIRLSQAGNPVGAAIVQSIQTQLQIDTVLPGNLPLPFHVFLAQPVLELSPKRTNTSDLELSNASKILSVGDFLTVSDAVPAPNKMIVVRVTTVADNSFQVDTDLSTFGPAGTTVSCSRLKRAGAELGNWPGVPDTAATVTFTSTALGQAKKAAFLWIEDNAGNPLIRTVKGINYDTLFFLGPLPGNNNASYDVERIPVQPPDYNVIAIGRAQQFTLNPVAKLDGVVAFELDHVSGTAISGGGSLLSAAALASGAAVAKVSVAAASLKGGPTPSQLAVLTQGPTAEAALVKEVRVTASFDRPLPKDAAESVEAIALRRGGDAYDATRVAALQVNVAATVGGAAAPVPHYLVNDSVTLSWQDPSSSPPANRSGTFTVQAINGTTLTLVYASGSDNQLSNTVNNLTITNANIAAGTAYDAVSLDPKDGNSRVVVQPTIGGTRAHMPRFLPGELVEADWPATLKRRQYRITDNGVEGTTLTLEGDAAIPAGVAGLKITRMSITDPGNGGSRLAIRGTVGDPPNKIQFRVWSPNAFPGGLLVAIVIAGKSFPAVVDGTVNQDVEVEFFSPPKLNGAIDIKTPNVPGTGYSGRFSQKDAVITLLDTNTGFAGARPVPSPAKDLIIAIPYVESPLKVDGKTGSGTVLPPEDAENPGSEVDRAQSLIDHELTHTLQCATWGPLLLAFTPLGLIQAGFEFGSDVELPKFSKYVPAQFLVEPDKLMLRIKDPQGVQFETGSRVQVFRNGSESSVVLRDKEEDRFRVTELIGFDHDEVQVRLQKSTESIVMATIFETLQLTTLGGLLEFVSGLHYGGLTYMIGKLFYALGRAVSHAKDFPAKAENPTLLRLANEGDAFSFRGVSQVTIQSNGTRVVRTVKPIADTAIHLEAAVPFKGEIRVAPYSLQNASSGWDWNSYFPATVPDPSRPTTLHVEKVGNKSLELQPLDMVTVTADGTQSVFTSITSVGAGGLVDLQDRPPKPKDPQDLRIARLRGQDPLGTAGTFVLGGLDSWAVTRGFNLGWMRWMLDPFGQLNYRLKPKLKSHWDIPFRIGRYLFGTKSFAIFPPVFGYIWWDRFFPGDAKGYLSALEQGASEESGDLYSPIGRLSGKMEVVGDIVRYWYFMLERSGTVVNGGMLDAPGAQIRNLFRVLPSLDTSTSDTTEPNRGAQAGANSGLDLPDIFVGKNTANPTATVATAPKGFQPVDLGFIPVSATLERASGIFCGFSRPGKHRITLSEIVFGADKGRDAQEKGKQTLFFDVNVKDVLVALSGQPLAQGAAITMVQRQRAVILVIPDGDRRYTTTVTAPGSVLNVDGDLVLTAQNVGSESVEISRVHSPATLLPRGLHMSIPVHVPVRAFTVQVVNTLPIRTAADPAAPGKDTWKNGETGFVLVPAPVGVDLVQSPLDANAKANITIEDHPELKAFLGDGRVYKVNFVASSPAQLKFVVQVGAAAPFVPLTATVSVTT